MREYADARDAGVCAGSQPRAGSGVVRMDPLRFLAGYRKRQLNHLSSLSLDFSLMCLLCCEL